MDWASQFYKQQFLLSQIKFDETSQLVYLQEASRIQEQMGKSFHKVLELGAGNGQLANTLASQNFDLTTIELVQELVTFAKANSLAPINILCGDFYELNLSDKFDCILYIDGFGVGEDEDQLRLLKRIYDWLNNDGYALIDIYEPNYWRQVYKEEIVLSDDSKILRKYNFDEKTLRFSDTWWHKDNEADKFTQSLKCYSTQCIYELCQSANLDIIGYFPNGAMDFETWSYSEPGSIDYCISYRIKLKKK